MLLWCKALCVAFAIEINSTSVQTWSWICWVNTQGDVKHIIQMHKVKGDESESCTLLTAVNKKRLSPCKHLLTAVRLAKQNKYHWYSRQRGHFKKREGTLKNERAMNLSWQKSVRSETKQSKQSTPPGEEDNAFSKAWLGGRAKQKEVDTQNNKEI